MRARIITVAALAGGLLLGPPTLGLAQAGTMSHGNWHNWHEHYRPNFSICGNPRFEFWYGYWYYPGCRCLYHGWWRTCTVGDVTP